MRRLDQRVARGNQEGGGVMLFGREVGASWWSASQLWSAFGMSCAEDGMTGVIVVWSRICVVVAGLCRRVV